MSITGERDGKPVRMGYLNADLVGGLYLALVGSLLGAACSGNGSHVQVSLFDCQIALLTWQAQNSLIVGEVPRRVGSRCHMIGPSEVFGESNGNYFVISLISFAHFRLCYMAELATKQYGNNWYRGGHREVKRVAPVCPGDIVTTIFDDSGLMQASVGYNDTVLFGNVGAWWQ